MKNMEDEDVVEVCFQGDEDILAFIIAVDEQEVMNSEVGEAAIEVSRDFFVSYPAVALLAKVKKEMNTKGCFHKCRQLFLVPRVQAFKKCAYNCSQMQWVRLYFTFYVELL